MSETIERDEMRILEKARRLVKFATGEEWGDGEIVSDIGIGIVEPGYGDNETVWALGNWNPKRWVRDGDAPLNGEESLPERLGEALERIGAEVHWSDEWLSCGECGRIFRSEPDSYTWKFQGVITEHGGVYCFDHATEDLETLIEQYVNQPTRAITLDVDLSEIGFEQFNGRFESGWHPGQNDKPEEIDKRAAREGWLERVFLIDDVGQFDIRFSLWVRNNEEDEEE